MVGYILVGIVSVLVIMAGITKLRGGKRLF